MKLEGMALRWGIDWMTCFFRCPGVCWYEEYIWRNERNTSK